MYWERALQIDVQAASDLHLRADEGDLFELLGNLLENAYKHAMRKVRVHAQRQGRELQIDIEDDGKGIPKGDMSRLLQRGERAGDPRRRPHLADRGREGREADGGARPGRAGPVPASAQRRYFAIAASTFTTLGAQTGIADATPGYCRNKARLEGLALK